MFEIGGQAALAAYGLLAGPALAAYRAGIPVPVPGTCSRQ
jgi:hypothetical protein